MFVGNKAFTNLPRKFNVGISGCTEHCTHAESQDLALTPAVKTGDGRDRHGFNVAVGGKMGSGGCRIASPLDIFVEPGEAAALCREIVLLFRDHGSRGARNRARLSFLVENWGAERFPAGARSGDGAGRSNAPARDARVEPGRRPHRRPPAEAGGPQLRRPAGRRSAAMPAAQLRDVARAADGVRDGRDPVHDEPERRRSRTSPTRGFPRCWPIRSCATCRTTRPAPPRGLVACTGIDYCHFALIETKELAVQHGRVPRRRACPTISA